ncbi:M48 family metallopeptidase [Amaricoccus sp.]|uniref:M48 family metallopeptidase n=1 Tax=Amaricoccus sp. TaxID=1872485 RepID=UPI001B5953FD|nr:M48 family metallopeptidase [Amaricoccus sp.]MBP7240492.1 M48 family metallopeptidase [Amaricoccus sp.]
MSICAERAAADGLDACDFTFVLVEAPTAPPNAFQTRSSDGKPVITVNSSLLAQLRDDDELATVLSHEAAHHVAGHIDRMNDRTSPDAFLPGDAGGYTAQSDGRARGRALELEADWIGAFIAERSGYDPAHGANIFERAATKQGAKTSRTSSHPDPSQRLEVVAAAVAEIGRQRSAGLTPRPESAPAL